MDKDGRRSPKIAKVFDGKMCDVGPHHRLRPSASFLLAFGSTRALTRAGKEKAETMRAGKMEESRERNRPLKVFVSERERAEIETRAAATGLSVSAYLRNLGLGFQPHSTLDQEAILALLRVNADQGRLGGLFKLRLSGQSVSSGETMEIRKLLAAIEESQLKLKGLIGRLSG